MNHRPRYDIAYSMLALDEPYARRLITELKKRLPGEQYLYSRKTEDVTEDNDLASTFGPIFSADSRLVVLLYRPGWGDTPFTAVEQDAIKARTLNEPGVRSVFVVAMQPPHIPWWFPEYEFWADADLYSVPQISAMIEFALARERTTGAQQTRPQGPAPVQERERAAGQPAPRQDEQGSVATVSVATVSEAEKLLTALVAEATEVTRAGLIRAACELTSTACTVTYNQTMVQLKLVRTEPTPYVNAALTAWVNVSDDTRESLPFGEWRLIQTLGDNDEWLWKFGDALLTSQQLARTLIERLVELAHEDRSNPRIAERSIKPPLT